MDWVTARSVCSLNRVFQTLYEVIDSDVKTANGLRLQGVGFHASFQHKKVVVTREENDDAVRAVVFELTPVSIVVREGKSKELFSAKPRLSDTGECMLEVDGQLYQLWQISQKALEDLFFA